jgi:hypothetical protein
MEKMSTRFFNATDLGVRLEGALTPTNADPSSYPSDTRLGQLLLVLNELEASMAALEDLPDRDLTELISTAMMACGFTDPAQIRCAIAEILETIEVPQLCLTPDSGTERLC